MNTNNPEHEALEFFKAMTNPDRLRIAGIIGIQPMSREALIDRLNIPLREMMTHLGMMEHLHILRCEQGLYYLDEVSLQAMAKRVLAGSRPAPKLDDLPEDEYDRKIIRDYSKADGSLKEIPLQQKKYLAVLRYVIQVFEVGKDYPEKQVNELLRRYHEDTATLRRGLVDFHFMIRDKGIYQRVESSEGSPN
jgi:hypothetical protein